MEENRSTDYENEGFVVQKLGWLIHKTEEMERQLEDAIREQDKRRRKQSPEK